MKLVDASTKPINVNKTRSIAGRVIMIHPRPGPIGLNSINTIETKAHMATVMTKMLAIKVRKLQGLNPHRKIKEEEKKVEKRKQRTIDYMI